MFQHVVVVRPCQTDCDITDVTIRMSADVLSQKAKWLLCCENCRVF